MRESPRVVQWQDVRAQDEVRITPMPMRIVLFLHLQSFYTLIQAPPEVSIIFASLVKKHDTERENALSTATQQLQAWTSI